MDTPSRKSQVLESCPVADEAVWLRHIMGFVTAFVTPSKKERWLDLLSRRPRKILGHSHKLHSALDRRTCHVVGKETVADLRGIGVFYDFHADGPRMVPADLAVDAAEAGDAIFSLVPGELAVYFFHEGEVWLCQGNPQFS